MKLEYYVLAEKNNKIIRYNVLNDWEEDIRKIKKEIKKKTELKEWLIKEFKYYYWSRAEHEVIVSDLFNKTSKKIDVWYQLELNIDIITDYVWEKMKFKEK